MLKISNFTLILSLALFSLGTACTDNSPEQKVELARLSLKNSDRKSAAIQLKSVLQANPDLAEARFLLGSILLDEGDAKAAEVEFRKALAAKYPESLTVPPLARSMLVLGQTKKLVDEFGNKIFDQPTAVADLQTTLAAAHKALGKPGLAEAALSAALRADANYAPALLNKSRQMASSGDFQGALQTTETILAREAKNAEAWKLKGDILLTRQNMVDEALLAYRESIEAKPDFLQGHLALLAVLMQQGRLEDAASQMEKLRKFAASNIKTKYIEAQLSFQKGDFKRARELSQQLLKASPNSPLFLQMAGAIELQLNATTQAEAYLEKAVKAAPKLVTARHLLIRAYLRSGNPAKALAALNVAIGKDGLEPGLASLAGEVYLLNGNAKKAAEYFSEAARLNPQDTRIRTALAISHIATDQTEIGFDELQIAAASDREPTADLALISARLRRGEFDKALSAIDKLEAKLPNNPLAANLRGRVKIAQKDTAAARKNFERALAIDPSYFAAVASLAALDMAEKKPIDAKKRFEVLLAKNPKSGQALFAMAEIAAAQGAGKEEIGLLLNRAIDSNPNDLAPRLVLIELHLRTHNAKQAIAVAQGAVAALPDSPEALDALGRSYQASGDMNQAIATFGRLAALRPQSPQPQVRLAGAYLASGNKQTAEQSLRRALVIAPEHLDAQRALITLALESRKYEDAFTIARIVQKQNPKTGLGMALEGDINIARKDWGAAALAYRAALKKHPSSELAVKLHAVTLNARKTAEADRLAATWLNEYPKDSRFLSYLASVALANNDYGAAEKVYLRMLHIQSSDAVALHNLAWVTHKLGKGGALDYAERAYKLSPNTIAFMETLATILSEKGDHARAIELLRSALSLQPTNSVLKLNLAKVYIAAGDRARAKTALEDLAKLGDKHPLFLNVSTLLKAL